MLWRVQRLGGVALVVGSLLFSAIAVASLVIGAVVLSRHEVDWFGAAAGWFGGAAAGAAFLGGVYALQREARYRREDTRRDRERQALLEYNRANLVQFTVRVGSAELGQHVNSFALTVHNDSPETALDVLASIRLDLDAKYLGQRRRRVEANSEAEFEFECDLPWPSWLATENPHAFDLIGNLGARLAWVFPDGGRWSRSSEGVQSYLPSSALGMEAEQVIRRIVDPSAPWRNV
jgi:hypothetical protein